MSIFDTLSSVVPQPNLLASFYLLHFYDSTLSQDQYYPAKNIIGWEKVNSASFKIYIKGAKDVNAKEIITITHLPAMTYNNCVRAIYTAIVTFQQGEPGDPPLNVNIIDVITEAASPNLVPQFTSCTIAYGSCCGEGADKEKGTGRIMKVGVEYYIPFTQTDLVVNLGSTRGAGSDTGTGFNSNDLSGNNWYETMVPLGWKVTGGVAYGAGTTNNFILYEAAINSHTITAKTASNTVNAPADITDDGNTDIVGDGIKTVLIFFENRDITENFYGGKIIVERV